MMLMIQGELRSELTTSEGPPRGGLVSQEKLRKLFEMFAGGRWEELLIDSEGQEATAATLRRRRRRRSDNVEDRRVSKALGLVQTGRQSGFGSTRVGTGDECHIATAARPSATTTPREGTHS